MALQLSFFNADGVDLAVGADVHRAEQRPKVDRHRVLEACATVDGTRERVVAEGGADIYPRLGPTSEWDTAAAQAVVEQAGGSVVTLDGKPMKYNQKEDILNPHFLVIGATDHDWLALLPDRE